MPELMPFPHELMRDDMTEEETTRALQDLMGNFCDVLGALHAEFDDDGIYDDETGDLRQ